MRHECGHPRHPDPVGRRDALHAHPAFPCGAAAFRGGWHGGAARGGGLADVGSRRRLGAGGAFRRLAGAVRDRPRGRSALGDHGPCLGDHRPCGCGVFARRHRRASRAVRLLRVPAFHDAGCLRVVPHGRHLQHVRVVRGHADQLVRPHEPRRRAAPDGGGGQIRHAQPHLLEPVPRRVRHPLRADGNTQHGRPRGAFARIHEAGIADHDGDAVPRGLRPEGGDVPAVFLASSVLPHAAGRGVRGLCRVADQGGCVCVDPAGHADLHPRRGLHARVAAGPGRGDDDHRCARCDDPVRLPAAALFHIVSQIGYMVLGLPCSPRWPWPPRSSTSSITSW